ncbi:MAG: SCPU domain-containing protein, partial [Variovorax sp.]
CFNIGDGAQSLGFFNPRNMEDSAGNDLRFQIYQSASATIWGSNGNTQVPNPFAVNLTIPRRTTAAGNGRVTGSATMRGVLAANQSTVPPGTYQDNFAGVHTSISQTISTTAMPTTCDTLNTDKFEFIASATVTKSCVVTATPLNFGPVDGLPGSVNIDGQSTISVKCSRPTPYTVALTPQNGNAAGAGVLRAVTGGNTDTVPYRLFSNAGRTVPWGNSGNTVGGTGTGLAQSLPVYGRVPNANVTPDDYLDIVTVNVSY